MRRSICTTDPHIAIAGQRHTWRFSYTPANDLVKGTKITFDLLSEGRNTDWEIPQTNVKKKVNLIWAELPNSKIIPLKHIKDASFSFDLPANLKAGENLIISMGSMDNNEKNGTLAQSFIQRKRLFKLHIDGKQKETEVFHLDIRGNKLHNLRIITPSIVARNRRFDVIVRFEDEFGNLTNNAPENTLIELTYEHLRENLNWKLFIPDTGFITLPNLYFNEPGVYKIQLKNLSNLQLFYSSPIKCFQESNLNLFWGLLHGESTRYDASDNIENCLRLFRDDEALSFYSTSPFDSEKETSADLWKKLNQQISEFNENERYITFLGLQWLGSTKEEGLRQFIFSKDNKPIIRKKDLKNNSLRKIYKSYSPKDFISIPTFTMYPDTLFDFENFNPEFERVVEIYNAWGSSENTTKDGNLRPIKSSKKSPKEQAEGSIQKALLKNHRFGFIAGGLDDRGIYSQFFESDQIQYSPGLTGIIAKDLSREALFEALYNRSCYATTGKHIIMGFNIANEPMGKELSTFTKPGLKINRYISGYVIGTDKIKEVQILRNNKIINTYHPDSNKFDFSFDDSEPIENVALKSKDKPDFVFYYLRAYQEDSHIAWSSPIWIDIQIAPPNPIKKIKKLK